jgi:hypothetical protein
VQNFYEVIAGRAKPMVSEPVTLRVTEILDSLWTSIEKEPVPPIRFADEKDARSADEVPRRAETASSQIVLPKEEPVARTK